MSEEMSNDAINADDIFDGAKLCINGTTITLCNNTTTHTQGMEFNDELIVNCRYYLEGIALTPISVFGMLGMSYLKTFCRSRSFPNLSYRSNLRTTYAFHSNCNFLHCYVTFKRSRFIYANNIEAYN